VGEEVCKNMYNVI